MAKNDELQERSTTEMPPQGASVDSIWEIGSRSSVSDSGESRFELARLKRHEWTRRRPFVLIGVLVILGVAAFLGYLFASVYVLPSQMVAVRVGDVSYTRGDLVDFIRFEQRVVEEMGGEFSIGTSLFDALDTLTQYELAHQSAPRFNIIVTGDEVDENVRSILGFTLTSPEETVDDTYLASFDEAKRQFLTKANFSEDVWLNFVRKALFRDKLRDVLAEDVPRVQPHVRVHAIGFRSNPGQDVIRAIEREIQSGQPLDQVTLAFSEDPNILRHMGDLGWIPNGVTGELDALFFGVGPGNNRLTPLGTPTAPYFDSDNQLYNVYILSEYEDARPVSEPHFEILSDRALTIFFNQERTRRAGDNELFLELNDEIYDWVFQQVEAASISTEPEIDQAFPFASQ